MNDTPIFVPAAQIWALRGIRPHKISIAGLYVDGNIEALAAPTVALVGGRAASEAGRRIAWRFAAELGQAGVCVVSGLALGVDGAAHSGSLSVGAATVGVLGGGHRHFFPRRNRPLARAIIEKGGAVVSHYSPDMPPLPFQFLERNGVIAALADAVVVIEAATRSGALNTATWGGDENIPVLAVPGDIDRPKVAGCNTLIRDGATLVTCSGDILEAIGMHRKSTENIQQTSLPLGELAAKFAKTISAEPTSAEALVARHAAGVPETLHILTSLTLAGIVLQRDDGAYVLTHPGKRGPIEINSRLNQSAVL